MFGSHRIVDAGSGKDLPVDCSQCRDRNQQTDRLARPPPWRNWSTSAATVS